MPRVEAIVSVPLTPEETFRLSQSQGELRYRWDPFVRRQQLMGGATEAGKGVRTWTRSRHGLQMVSEYVSFRPPHQVGMKMVKGPWFFRSFSGGWNFAPDKDGGTVATWRYTFACRPGWLAPIGNRVGTWLLGRDIRRRLDAFARACSDPEVLAAAGLGAGSRPGPPESEVRGG